MSAPLTRHGCRCWISIALRARELLATRPPRGWRQLAAALAIPHRDLRGHMELHDPELVEIVLRQAERRVHR